MGKAREVTGVNQPPSAAAIRQRRRRERKKVGVNVLPIEVSREVVEGLVFQEQISTDEARCPEKLSAAIGDLLEALANGR